MLSHLPLTPNREQMSDRRHRRYLPVRSPMRRCREARWGKNHSGRAGPPEIRTPARQTTNVGYILNSPPHHILPYWRPQQITQTDPRRRIPRYRAIQPRTREARHTDLVLRTVAVLGMLPLPENKCGLQTIQSLEKLRCLCPTKDQHVSIIASRCNRTRRALQGYRYANGGR